MMHKKMESFNRRFAALAVCALCALPGFALTGCGAAGQGEELAAAVSSADEALEANDIAQAENDEELLDDVASEGEPAQDFSGALEAAVQPVVGPYGTQVGVAVLPLENAVGYSSNGDEQIVSASMIKLLVLAEFMSQVDAGTIDLNGTYTLAASDIVGGSGIIAGRGAGAVLTYDEIAQSMIAQSDNTAANILIDLMGMDAINAKAQQLGLTQTVLNRKMMDSSSGLENYTSANDIAALLRGIANETIASAGMCERAQSYLLAQYDAAALSQGLPAGVSFGHKTGSLATARNDGGIVYAQEHPYVVVVLCSLGGNVAGEGQANSIMAQVSSAVYTAMESAAA